MSETHDYFKKQADAYASARPTYPDALYQWIMSHVQADDPVTWDCATGSGQVARGLVEHVGRVIATDVSAEQLARAPSTRALRTPWRAPRPAASRPTPSTS